MAVASLVLDASVGLAWFFPTKPEERQYAGAVLDLIGDSNALIVVPSLFHVELGNFLLKRRADPASKFGKARLDSALALAHNLPLATLDRGLRTACEAFGVDIVGFN